MGFSRSNNGYNYYDCFIRVSKLANECATYLDNVFGNFDGDSIPMHAENMHKIENDADMEKHELTRHLAREFITPIEREDISSLSQELDNILDTVEDVIRRIYMFNVTSLRTEGREFTRLISDSCKAVEQLLTEFPNFKKSKILNDLIIEINTLENTGDKLHADSLRRLFTEESTANDRLVWMLIFESLEASLDACEHVANTIENIVMKNT